MSVNTYRYRLCIEYTILDILHCTVLEQASTERLNTIHRANHTCDIIYQSAQWTSENRPHEMWRPQGSSCCCYATVGASLPPSKYLTGLNENEQNNYLLEDQKVKNQIHRPEILRPKQSASQVPFHRLTLSVSQLFLLN